MESPNPAEPCGALPCAPPGGRRGVSPDLPLVGSLLEEQWPDCATDHGLLQPQAESLLVASSLQPASPLGYLGALLHSGTPGLSVTPRVLRPHCPTRVHPPLSHQSDVPQWSRLLKVPILCSAALSLARSGRRRPRPPPSILPNIASDSLLCTSYLLESGRFSVQRVVAILFFDLLLSL